MIKRLSKLRFFVLSAIVLIATLFSLCPLILKENKASAAAGNMKLTLYSTVNEIKTSETSKEFVVYAQVSDNPGSLWGVQFNIQIDTTIFEFVEYVSPADVAKLTGKPAPTVNLNAYEVAGDSDKNSGWVALTANNSGTAINMNSFIAGGYKVRLKAGATVSSGTNVQFTIDKNPDTFICYDTNYDEREVDKIEDASSTITFRQPSSACDMTALAYSGLTISKSGTNFSANVPYSTSSLNTANLRPTVSAGAKVTYSPNGNVALNEGVNTITMTVTPEDNSTPNTYTFVVTRANGETENTLKSLQVSNDGTTLLSKTEAELTAAGTFNLGKIPYANKDTIQVSAERKGNFSKMQIFVDGTVKYEGKDVIKTYAVGTLAAGNHTIKVVAIPEKASVGNKEYVMTFSVEEAENNKTLSSLVLKTTDGKEIRLMDAFDPSVTTYSATVPQGTGTIVVEATAAGGLAQVTGTGERTVPGSIEVVVTAQDGSSTTYTVIVSEVIDTSGLKLVNPSVWAVDADENEYLLTLNTVLEDVYYTVRIPHNYAISCYKIVASSSDPTYTLEGVNATFDITKGQTVPHRLNFRKNGHADKVIIVEITYETNVKTLDQIIYGNDVLEVTDKTDYVLNVSKNVKSLRIKAIPTQANATVNIVFSDEEIVFSDSEKVINLQSGRNIVLIKVQALNGDTEIYTLTIDREIVFNNLPYIIVIVVLGVDLLITIVVFSIIVTKLKRKLKDKISGK